jgi:uncharacterized cupredoxin-like copper-binding protein
MTLRPVMLGLLVVALTLGSAATAPAQTSTRRVFDIAMTSFKFEPSQIRVNEGDTVVIRLRNADDVSRFPHDIASRYFASIPLTVRGDARQAMEEDRRYVRLDAGRQAEIEFVATGRGSYAFICSVFTHSFAGMTGAIFVQPAGSP